VLTTGILGRPANARRMAEAGVLMGDKEGLSGDLERLCQAVSPNDEPCDYPATVHCATCGRWFCDAHAEDEEGGGACFASD